MLIGQTPLEWPEILNHSVAIGVLMFIGTLSFLWYKRTYGVDGTDTKKSANRLECEKNESANRVECEKKNSDTLAASQVTLVELKDLAAMQQERCGVHANGLAVVATKLGEVDTDAGAARVASETVAKEWGNVNHKEFRTPPMLDALTHTVDMLEKMEIRRGYADECREEFVLLRSQIQEIKREMTRGTP